MELEVLETRVQYTCQAVIWEGFLIISWLLMDGVEWGLLVFYQRRDQDGI